MSQEVNEMRQIRFDKLDRYIAEGRDPHKIEHFRDRTLAQTVQDNFDALEETSVRLAGRIMGKRGHGKVIFMDLQDSSGRIQLFNQINNLGPEKFDQIKDLDLGDIVGVEGEVFRTKAGEISIRTKELTLLTKGLQILPEKFHGLKDQDLRYRQRYVDLIVNPQIKETFLKRSKIIQAIRRFLDERGFMEVETPILNTIAGGANARPFITHHNTLDIDMYLRIANELYLKRLIVGGFDKVYEMGRMFRNEGMSPSHNPEYTAIELYEAYADYEDMMDITEQLVSYVAQEVLGSQLVDFGGQEIDFTPPWRRVKMVDLIREETGIDFEAYPTDEEARQIALDRGVDLGGKTSRGEIIAEVFDHFCEDQLIQPTFVTHYPVEVSPLAKREPGDERYTHRFEAFVGGYEIANAFSELNDARDQKSRFEAQVRAREQGDLEAQMMDHDFINALEVGLPPTGGMGMGIDRLVMMLTGEESIRDVLLFPTMKPIGGQSPADQAAQGQEAPASDPAGTDRAEVDLSQLRVEPLFEEFVDFDTFSKSDFRAVKVLACEEVPKSKKLLKFTLDDGSGRPRTILSGIKDYYSAQELVGKTLVAITNLPPRKMMGIDSEGMIISALHQEAGEERLNLLIISDRIPAGAKLY